MSDWKIERISWINGNPVKVAIVQCTAPEYHGEWMGDEYITVDVREPEPVDFHLGDFVEYRGEKYSICYDPNVVKKARRFTYGEGFSYDSIKLYAASWQLKTIDFKDIVLDDNNLAYTSLSEFSFFAGSVEDLADRLQANLDRVSTDWIVLTPNWARCKQRAGQQREGNFETEWEFYYDDADIYGEWLDGNGGVTLGDTDINISVTSEQMCWDVLKASYEQFGLSYYIQGMTPARQGHVIVIGGAPIREPYLFRYGKHLGLYEIERTVDDGQELVTKVFGYGSETNLPLNYYANIGKKVKFTVWKKVRKTYISGHPTYYFWIDAIWDTSLSNAFPNLNVIVSRGQYSAKFFVSGSSTIFSDTEPRETNLDSPHLNFYWIDYGETDAYGLWQNVSVGDTIYIEGANINAIPSQYVEIPHEYDYPTLLSINKLMLPGFPDMTLHDWLTACSQDSSVDRGQWGGLSAEDATSMLQKYDFSGIEVGPEPASTASDAVKREYEEALRKAKIDPWIRSRNATTIGVFEGVVNYDGSSQKEIYPTIENTPSNVVVSADNITDNGYLEDNANKHFHIFVNRGLSYLDWSEALNTAIDKEGVSVEMTSGYCVGRKFKVISAASSSITTGNDTTYVWDLTCEREKDTSLERYFPYFDNDTSNYCQVLGGDTFVVTGIQMPELYIRYSSVKLLIAVCGWLDKRDHIRYTYVPKVDEIYMAHQHDSAQAGTSLHDTLKAGMQFQLEDAADLGITRYHGDGHTAPFIDQLTIKEDGNNGIPTYDVVLRDEKEKGALEKIIEKASQLQGATEVTERRTQQTSYQEYDHWEAGKSYYYDTLNVEVVPSRIETSRVRRWGGLWECRRSFTTEEPYPGCSDWAEIEKCPIVYVEYEEWSASGRYYYESPNPAKDIIETSRVRRWLGLWECRSNLTAQEPVPNCSDWAEIEKCPIQYVDYGEMSPDSRTYYYESPNPAEGWIETSRVHKWGITWECRHTGTTVTPGYGVSASEWVAISETPLTFYIEHAGNGTIASGETASCQLHVEFGTQSVTSYFNVRTLKRDDNTSFNSLISSSSSIFSISYNNAFLRTATVGGHQTEVLASQATFTATVSDGTTTLSSNVHFKRADFQIVDKGEWVYKPYDFEYDRGDDLSPRVVPAVWHDGSFWRCLVSGTTQEPSESATDWALVVNVMDNVSSQVQGNLKNYTINFTDYVDVISVDDTGNVIGGLWTDTSESSSSSGSSSDELVSRSYRIHSAITVRNNNNILLAAPANAEATTGTYKIYAEPHGCSCIINNSTIYVTGIDNIGDGITGTSSIYITDIDNVRDGVAGSSDDLDFDYDAMRAMESCWVDLVIDCEGEASITKRFPVRISHDPLPFVSIDLSNQMSAVSWNSNTASYVGLPIVFDITMWHNDEVLDIASTGDVDVVLDVPGEDSTTIASYRSAMTISKALVTDGDGHKTVRVTVSALPSNFPLVSELNITGAAEYAGVTYERTVKHVINKSYDANVYQIVPSHATIEGHYNSSGSLVLSDNTLTCSVTCASTNDNRSYNVPQSKFASLGLSLKYKIDDAVNWTSYPSSGGISVTTSNKKVYLLLEQTVDGVAHTHDQEEVPIICDGAGGSPGTLTQRRYKSTSSSTNTETPSGASPSGWVDYPTTVDSTSRYRWMIERISNDGGETWSSWSAPVIDFYLAEDGTSINIKGTAVAVSTGAGVGTTGDTTWPNPSSGDIVLENGTYSSSDTRYWNGSAWTDGLPNGGTADEGDSYIVTDTGHLWQLVNDSHAAGRWADLGQIKGDKGDDAVAIELVPSTTEVRVTRSSANVFSPSTVDISCGYRKSVGSTITSEANATSPIVIGDTTFYIYFRKRVRSTQLYSGVYYCYSTYNGTAYARMEANDISTSLFDEMEFFLSKETPTLSDGIYIRTTMPSYIDMVTIPFSLDGADGMGRNPWYAGNAADLLAADANYSFVVNDHSTPYFEVDEDGSNTYYIWVGANGTYTLRLVTDDNTDWSGTSWSEMNTQFKYLITEATFANFAKLGSSVFNGVFQFSQEGWMKGFDGLETPIYDGSQFQNADPTDMLGEGDLKTGALWNNILSRTYSYSDFTAVATAVTLTGGKWYSFKFSATLNRGSGTQIVMPSAYWKIATGASASGVQSDSAYETITNIRVIDDNNNTCNFYVSTTGSYNLYVKVANGTLSLHEYYLNACKFVPKYVLNTMTGALTPTTLPAHSIQNGFSEVASTTSTLNISKETIVMVKSRSSVLTVNLPIPDASKQGRIIDIYNPSGASVKYGYPFPLSIVSVNGEIFKVPDAYTLVYNVGYTYSHVRFLCNMNEWYVLQIES